MAAPMGSKTIKVTTTTTRKRTKSISRTKGKVLKIRPAPEPTTSSIIAVGAATHVDKQVDECLLTSATINTSPTTITTTFTTIVDHHQQQQQQQQPSLLAPQTVKLHIIKPKATLRAQVQQQQISVLGGGVVRPDSILKKDVISEVQRVDTLPASSYSNIDTTDLTCSKKLNFKSVKYSYLVKGPDGKKRYKSWKNLKQLVTAERNAKPGQPTYGGLDAAPSTKPTKKYSDISGLAANYTDPTTKLRYSNCAEFAELPKLPPDVINGYLSLRGITTTSIA